MYVYENTTTQSVSNLFSLAFQQLKSIGSGYAIHWKSFIIYGIYTTQCLAFLFFESFKDKRHDMH
jgi:hypothetical protein